jgi:hypothetical protein
MKDPVPSGSPLTSEPANRPGISRQQVAKDRVGVNANRCGSLGDRPDFKVALLSWNSHEGPVEGLKRV